MALEETSCVLCSSAFRLAMVQMAVGGVKKTNLERAASLIAEATKQGADMVILPVRSSCLLLSACVSSELTY